MDDKKKIILLVDDDMTNLTVGEKALDGHYSVVTLNSGMLLLEMLGRINPDLVLLDVNMPGMDGYETLRRIKADPKTAGTRVIFLTARNDKKGVMEGIAAGACGYVVKPFSPPDLLKRIEAHFLSNGEPLPILLPEDDTAPDPAEESAQNLDDAPQEEPAEKASIFPEGHGSYDLELDNESAMLREEQIACPVCEHSFSYMAVHSDKLEVIKSDDMRVWHKDIETMHYDIISCPDCFYSATTEFFGTASKEAQSQINQAIEPHRAGLKINCGLQRDTFAVFVGYYLAILCAPCFDDHHMIRADLWLKLGWLYQDCSDIDMYGFVSAHALDEYTHAYNEENNRGNQTLQLLFTLGDMHQRAGNFESAQEFFEKVKNDESSSASMARKAARRIDEVEELIKLCEGITDE